MSESEITKHIAESYRKILKRDPDPQGLSHYLKEIMEGRLSTKQLDSILENSEEYVLLQSKQNLQIAIEKAELNDVTLNPTSHTSEITKKSLSQLYDYLQNCAIIPGPKGELKNYVDEAFYRFVKTLQLITSDSKGKLLEIGSNPYFLTTLLKKFRQLELNGCNYFSTADDSMTQTVINEKYGEVHTYNSKLFNIETDRFPYDDNSFDYVLICEVIEHMTKDPIHVLQEIHRVLKPQGTVVLTTPNVARESNIKKLERGENIYDPYSRYGIYGRHNREYTVNELDEIFSKTGFSIERKFTKFVHFGQPDADWWKMNDTDNFKGDYIFILARKSRSFEQYRPGWLFR